MTLDAKTKWQRIEPKDGNYGSYDKSSCRCFGLRGKQYPRIVLKVSRHRYDTEELVVNTYEKFSPNDNWSECLLPIELTSELIEMLEAFK